MRWHRIRESFFAITGGAFRVQKIVRLGERRACSLAVEIARMHSPFWLFLFLSLVLPVRLSLASEFTFLPDHSGTAAVTVERGNTPMHKLPAESADFANRRRTVRRTVRL